MAIFMQLKKLSSMVSMNSTMFCLTPSFVIVDELFFNNKRAVFEMQRKRTQDYSVSFLQTKTYEELFPKLSKIQIVEMLKEDYSEFLDTDMCLDARIVKQHTGYNPTVHLWGKSHPNVLARKIKLLNLSNFEYILTSSNECTLQLNLAPIILWDTGFMFMKAHYPKAFAAISISSKETSDEEQGMYTITNHNNFVSKTIELYEVFKDFSNQVAKQGGLS